jgi:hypothetical protein
MKKKLQNRDVYIYTISGYIPELVILARIESTISVCLCLCDDGGDVHDPAQIEHDVLAEVGLLGAPGCPRVEPAILRCALIPLGAGCHV